MSHHDQLVEPAREVERIVAAAASPRARRLFEVAVSGVGELCGFDCGMVYRLRDNGAGGVIAYARDPSSPWTATLGVDSLCGRFVIRSLVSITLLRTFRSSPLLHRFTRTDAPKIWYQLRVNRPLLHEDRSSMITVWIGFVLFVLLMLALDLGVFHRKAHVVSMREALGWSAFWIGLGLSFSVFIYFAYGRHWFGLGTTMDVVGGQPNDAASATVKYLTGYIIEKSLSVDNIFVIAMIFGFLAVPPIYQHRVLFWGILGALIMRGLMIGIGAELVARYHWVLYVFGAFLLFTAVKMLLIREHSDPAENFVVRWLKRFFPITDRFHGQHFIVRAGSPGSHEAVVPGAPVHADAAVDRARPGTLMLTPLALALVLVETTDLIFAVDSIPAIFAITSDPFLVFTSNVFAILGLRSLYFALAGLIDKFRYLKLSLALVLAVVGLKMLFAAPLKQAFGPGFNVYLLLVVLVILVFGVLASLWTGPRIGPGDVLAQKKDDQRS